MAQFGRPVADVYNADGYTTGSGATGSLFSFIDEAVQDDNDYVRSALTPTSDVFVVRLTTGLENPLLASSHIVRYAYGKDAASGDQIDLTVQLRQGYVTEGTQGTLITQAVHTNIATAFTATAFTLTTGAAALITDYGDLYLRFVSNKV